MRSPATTLLCMTLCLIGLVSVGQAADVTVSLVPTTSSFPLVGYPGDVLTDAFKVHFAIGGGIPKQPSNPPEITFCTSLVLNNTGALSCTEYKTISLLPGTNYTQNPGLVPPDSSVSLTIAADVPCGATYAVSEHIAGNAGSGVDLGAGATFVDLAFSVQVLCKCGGCTLSQGFWKNHPEAWPLASLSLGNTTYTKAQLIQILKTEVTGSGLVSLAHQLIAAKLNVANGATNSVIGGIITAADSLIGSLVVPPVGSGSLDPSQTSTLNDSLTSFNEGVMGPAHCPEN